MALFIFPSVNDALYRLYSFNFLEKEKTHPPIFSRTSFPLPIFLQISDVTTVEHCFQIKSLAFIRLGIGTGSKCELAVIYISDNAAVST